MRDIERIISIRFSKDNAELFWFLKSKTNTNAYILQQLRDLNIDFLKWKIKQQDKILIEQTKLIQINLKQRKVK